ncbi:hypothetical protein ATJ97_2690 [Georgenia soli]|uniref:Uncharacterized protein n=1 Tax=Georgenia soli TaxID=638953 RepID=A0A2A9EPN2_9MICO|nr:hypothetical protein [Georgenia soli]PFG40169.1 hypothetical protein ATJ97_2690 [Georgenia soli]
MSENDEVVEVVSVRRRPPREGAERHFWTFDETYQDRLTSFVSEIAPTLGAQPYTPESLGAVEALFLGRVQAPEDLDDGGNRAFFLDVLRYVGETLLRTCGGEWEWEELWESGGPGAGLPFVRVDAPTGYLQGGTVDMYATLTGAAAARTGHYFRDLVTAVLASFGDAGPLRRSSGWQAMGVDDPTATNPALREYLADHQARLDAFTTDAAAGNLRLDYTEESLHRLEAVLLEAYPDRPELEADFDTPFVQGAARYVAETFTRIAGGRIDIVDPSVLTRPPHPNDKLPYVQRVHDDGEASSIHWVGAVLTAAVRANTVGKGPRAVLPRTGDTLRKRLHRYAQDRH